MSDEAHAIVIDDESNPDEVISISSASSGSDSRGAKERQSTGSRLKEAVTSRKRPRPSPTKQKSSVNSSPNADQSPTHKSVKDDACPPDQNSSQSNASATRSMRSFLQRFRRSTCPSPKKRLMPASKYAKARERNDSEKENESKSSPDSKKSKQNDTNGRQRTGRAVDSDDSVAVLEGRSKHGDKSQSTAESSPGWGRKKTGNSRADSDGKKLSGTRQDLQVNGVSKMSPRPTKKVKADGEASRNRNNVKTRIDFDSVESDDSVIVIEGKNNQRRKRNGDVRIPSNTTENDISNEKSRKRRKITDARLGIESSGSDSSIMVVEESIKRQSNMNGRSKTFPKSANKNVPTRSKSGHRRTTASSQFEHESTESDDSVVVVEERSRRGTRIESATSVRATAKSSTRKAANRKPKHYQDLPQLRCPLCWSNFPLDEIEYHFEYCGRPSPKKRKQPKRSSSSSPADLNTGSDESSIQSQSSESESILEVTPRKENPPPEKTTRHSNRATSRTKTHLVTTQSPTAKSPDLEEEIVPKASSPQRKEGRPSPSDKDNPRLRKVVEDTLRQARQQRLETQQETLRKMLIAKNSLLQQVQHRNTLKSVRYSRLPRAENKELESSYMKERDHPLPRDSHHTIFVRKHFSSLNDDDTSSGDERDEVFSSKHKEEDESEGVTSEDYGSVEELEKRLSPSKKRFTKTIAEFMVSDRVGAGYEEDEIDADIDRVLEALRNSPFDHDDVNEYLATLLQEDEKRIQRRWVKSNSKDEPRRQHATPYENVMSSFRDLFCRRCLVFDCNLHGLQEDFDPAVQAELAVHLDTSGGWKGDSIPYCVPVGSTTMTEKDDSHAILKGIVAPELSESQKLLSQRLFHLFHNDIGKVSQATKIPQSVLRQQVGLLPLKRQHTKFLASSSHSRTKGNKSNHYHADWMKRIEEATSHPFFSPCTHEGQCSEENCSCIQNRFFCMKACLWGASSRNYFRGCNCLSKCTARSCPCLASNRECDPDLCTRCGACSDPPNQAVSEQNCRNDSISMRRHAHLLLGKSDVAGWGLFTKFDIKRGDYVHEYLGELISHNEAECRGKVYDERGQTYIFDMSTDYAVDALRKGNKTRFINHSSNPNIGPKMRVVNGDYRIGFFALRDIPAHTELFFDYGVKFFTAPGGFN